MAMTPEQIEAIKQEVIAKISGKSPWIGGNAQAKPAPVAQQNLAAATAPGNVVGPSGGGRMPGTNAIIQNDINSGGEDFSEMNQEDPAAPKTDTTKPPSAMSKILPLLFRFGLPAIAGAALGNRSMIGGLAGGLTGLAAGGASQLNSMGQKEKLDSEEEQAKSSLSLKELLANYTNNRNTQRDNIAATNTAADNTRADAAATETQAYHKGMLAKTSASSMSAQEKALKDIDLVVGSRSVSDPATREIIKQAIAVNPAFKVRQQAKGGQNFLGFGGHDKGDLDDSQVNMVADTYINSRSGGKASPAVNATSAVGGKPAGAVSSQTNPKTGAIRYLDAQGNVIQ